MPAAQYIQQMKALDNVMAAASSPLPNEELVDYIITRLGKEYSALTATLTLGNKSMPYDVFYSHILSFEALQEQDQSADWSSLVNTVSLPGFYSNLTGRALLSIRLVLLASLAPIILALAMVAMAVCMLARATPPLMAANLPVAKPVVARTMVAMAAMMVVVVRTTASANAPTMKSATIGGMFRWTAGTANNQRARNTTSTSYNNDPPICHLDSGAMDHLTSDLARLHLYERYGGANHVQVANGAGLSIAHIVHSSLTGSSIHLKNILHVLHLSTHILSVNRLCSDNDIFVEFHHHFFRVKYKATRKILLYGRSKGGLYPIPLS
jgi:hypothetical protein